MAQSVDFAEEYIKLFNEINSDVYDVEFLTYNTHVMLTYQQHAIHHCAERSDGTMTSRSRGTWTSRRSTQCCRCADIVPTYCYLGLLACVCKILAQCSHSELNTMYRWRYSTVTMLIRCGVRVRSDIHRECSKFVVYVIYSIRYVL